MGKTNLDLIREAKTPEDIRNVIDRFNAVKYTRYQADCISNICSMHECASCNEGLEKFLREEIG